MDKYDGLALTVGTLWFCIASMPENIYYSMLEQVLAARIVLLLGLGAIFLLYGLRDNRLPLIVDFVSSVVSLVLISSMWKTLCSYTYIPSGHTKLTLSIILTILWFFGGSAAFYGLGGLIAKSTRGLQGSAKNE